MSSSNNFRHSNASTYVNLIRVLQRHRRQRNLYRILRRQGRRASINNAGMLRQIESLPLQQTTDPFANQLFNGSLPF